MSKKRPCWGRGYATGERNRGVALTELYNKGCPYDILHNLIKGLI